LIHRLSRCLICLSEWYAHEAELKLSPSYEKTSQKAAIRLTKADATSKFRMTARKISGLTATNIVVANMIGTGVVTSLGFQVAAIRSDFALIFLWAIGGVAALCGALCYAELAAALPRSGGEYHFLSRIYHPSIGFIAGWISATVGFAAPIAISAIAFGEYCKPFFPGVPPIVVGLVVAWLVTAIHLAGVHTGEIFQNVSTVLKVALILVLIVAGLFFGRSQPLDLALNASTWEALISGPFAVSLVFVMYSYSGWNAATYITGEVRNPAKNVPWALFTGTGIVIVLYVFLNAVFLLTTPKQTLSGQVEVGLLSGQAIFGAVGGAIVSGLIALGLVASISAMTWIGPHVTKTMAEDLPTLRIFSRVSKNGTPYVAMLFQLAMITFLLTTATFTKVLIYIQFSLLLCSFLTVVGLIVLRVREPHLERPYKVWAYPVTPIFFLLISMHMMIHVVRERPIESLMGFGTAAAGLIIFFLSRESSFRPIQ
jgi:basic amino acid/polyamine antiporter, APA family